MDEKPKRTIKKKFVIAEKASKAKGAVATALGIAATVAIQVAAQNSNSDDDSSMTIIKNRLYRYSCSRRSSENGQG